MNGPNARCSLDGEHSALRVAGRALIPVVSSQHAVIAARGAFAVALLMALCASPAHSVPLSVEELTKVCAEADDASHCGRMVEGVQLPRLPNLAVREKADLKVSLYPSGSVTFTDIEAVNGSRSYSLWDFLSEINAVVLYVTDADDTNFLLLQRTTGRKIDLPADPKLAPDRSRLVTADFCERRCTNEVALWRVTRDGVRKELVLRPGAPWTDVVATWKDADTVAIEYTVAGSATRSRLSRRVADAEWMRAPTP